MYATIPARDFDRAKRFYRDTIGLKVSDETEQDIRFESGDTPLTVFPTFSEEKAGHTLACWIVPNLASEMSDLRARGVTFEEYDLPGLKTVDGVAESERIRCAWFKDSEGNVLAVVEEKNA
ncbi:MAG: VOC family protein [Micromonosporaceae bacterium]